MIFSPLRAATARSISMHFRSFKSGRLLSVLILAVCLSAHAGNQKEEALADSVRLALARSISDARPPKPEFPDIEERIKYLHWLGEMSERLKKRLPDVTLVSIAHRPSVAAFHNDRIVMQRDEGSPGQLVADRPVPAAGD